MGAGMAIMGGIKVAGAIKGKKDAKKSSAAQSRIDAENRQRMTKENKEVLSRARSDVASVQSTGKTRAAGSGFAAGGVKTDYLERLSAVHERDLDWLEEAQDSGVSIASSEAAQRSRIAKDRASADFIGGIGSAVGSFSGGWGRSQSTGSWWA